MLFRIDTAGKAAAAVPASSFSELAYHERYDIQEWVLNNPQLLGEPLVVITSEFSGFDRTSERLDVLAMDRNGKLVVVELKRTAAGTTAELQALRYAAYCSTLRLKDSAELRARHSSRRGTETTVEEALSEIREFVNAPEFEELDDKPRIILAADDFGPELTASVLWLRSFEVDISCVRLTPYSVDDALVLDSTVLIPLPEAGEFVIRREKKEASRSSQGRAERPTLEEFVSCVPAPVRPLFLRMRDELARRPDVKETVFNNLISYRRASDNAWITWLQHTQRQARIAFPDHQALPEDLAVKSRDGWTTLGVTDEAALHVISGLIRERFEDLEREGGSSVLS